MQQKVRDWLSPPDPWKNHKIACETQLAGTGTWWTQGQAYTEWNSAGPSALLWIHGKRGCFACSHLLSLGTYEFSLFSWCWKERALVRELFHMLLCETLKNGIGQFCNYPGYPHAPIWLGLTSFFLL